MTEITRENISEFLKTPLGNITANQLNEIHYLITLEIDDRKCEYLRRHDRDVTRGEFEDLKKLVKGV
jgi:hypothetical protein